MVNLRILLDETTVFEGSTDAVPGAGDQIQIDDRTLHVESRTWEFSAANGSVAVTIIASDLSFKY